MPAPAKAAIIGPAAIKGPRPGIDSAPIPASQPSVPPSTAPVPAPVVAPSGALVFFSVMDAALIGAAQRVEHYEIAAYGTVKAFAETLGHSEHVSLLDETLEEEKQTDEKLTELAKQINAQAGSSDKEDERETTKKGRRVA
jgi:hypothetical protein